MSVTKYNRLIDNNKGTITITIQFVTYIFKGALIAE